MRLLPEPRFCNTNLRRLKIQLMPIIRHLQQFDGLKIELVVTSPQFWGNRFINLWSKDGKFHIRRLTTSRTGAIFVLVADSKPRPPLCFQTGVTTRFRR